MTSAQKNMRGQAGFTLVELAIVMIIIGLLIAGVLKGQALISNAKVTAQVAQVKAIDAATSTFKDMYSALPGDMGPAGAGAPVNRLPNCAAGTVCAQVGNGDGQLALAPGVGVTAISENGTYWAQLNAASLITGINPPLGLVFGGQIPAAKINGGIDVGSTAGAVLLGASAEAAVNTVGGLYLYFHLTPGAPAAVAVAPFSANEAQRIDTKLDDGVATSGSVFPFGAAATCWIAATGAYGESIQGTNCGLYVRIQG